ncbi:hypothetical protein OG824_31560 [Streptomyces prunicolor]|uniref:hypothetical protein n=1 Tax=Streptomyces prunicolor TaxID=67348 RepID=UPI00224EB085|nr:hypothetical protein [Streptomyces prunicolor]MCX5239747.1 hypothetical protein [Streptomyces prunicolor]
MTTTPHPDRTPIAHSVVYAVRGMPDVPNLYGPGALAPTEISLTYRVAEDSQSGRVHAYVKGHWRPEDGGQAVEGLSGQHYYGDTAKWPTWLADEARIHDPAVPSAVPVPATSARRATCPACEPLLGVQCAKEAGHEAHSDRPGRIWYPVADDGAPATFWFWTELREQIAAALIEWSYRGKNPEHGGILETVRANAYGRADAVLAVLPASVDRAAIYAEVADRLAADAEQGDKEGFTRIYHRAAASQVREWGAELAPDQNTAGEMTCSAQYDARSEEWDAVRLCIRAAHHVGRDHVDEHGFHWSDTVAVYPTAGGELQMNPVLAALRHVVCEVQQPEAQTRRPLVRWYVERRNHDGWWPDSSPTRPQERAAESLSERRAAHPGDEFRLARATTTYTVEVTDTSRPEDEAGLIVAYQSRDGRQLRCLVHAPAVNLIGLDWFARTGLDVDSDASSCSETGCGRDVLAEETPYCSAGLLPKGSAPVERCVVEVPHDEHVTAQGKRWTDEAST